jgi:ribosome-associated protein
MAGQDDLRVHAGLVIPASELRESATRSRGPGGQHVNKTSTRVTLRWNIESSEVLKASLRRRLRQRLETRISRAGDLVVHCDETRSQSRNREVARQRMAELVSAALARRKARRPTRPTQASRARRVDEKTKRSAVKRQRRAVRPDSD